MARTRNTPRIQNAEVEVEPSSPLVTRKESSAPTAKSVKPTIRKSTKRQRKADEANDTSAVVDNSAQSAPAKKMKMLAKTAMEPPVTHPQSPVRRSGRKQMAKTPPMTVQKRRRRTKEEIAADKLKAELVKKQQEERTKENNQAMMRMDTEEDVDRANTAAQAIRTFGDLDRDTESSGEDFKGYRDVSGGDSEESDVDDNLALQLKEANKALQEKVKALETKIGSGGGRGKENRMGGKKSTKQVTFASGLVSDWNSKSNSKERQTKPDTDSYVVISAGGLDDSDADAVNPFPKNPSHKVNVTDAEVTTHSQTAKRDFTRQNELISIVESDDESDYVPHPAAKKIAQKMTAAPRPIQVKLEKREKMPPNKILSRGAPRSKMKRMNGNNVRTSDLPEFAQNKWRDAFLPTLYDKFFTSGQPFDGFYKGSDQFITLLQAVIGEVFPDIDYQITSSDSLHFLAYNRINEKRSSIGSSAIDVVKSHIDALGDIEAKEWLRWSLRKDGPLFFKVPSPPDSPLDNEDWDYQFPEGRLLSKFIINLASPLLRLKSGSVTGNGYPKGLVALIMAALERAVRSLLKPTIKVKEFSKEFWGSRVDTYYSGLNGVPDNRWRELLEACGVDSNDSEDSDDHGADLSLLDHNRASIFAFCSPVKARA